MNNEANANRYLPIIIIIIFAGIFVGEAVIKTVTYETINQECNDYKNAPNNGLISSPECQNYPYKDGFGTLGTPPSAQGLSDNPYQPYFDLSVDFVRNFIQNECGGILNNCASTNFIYETQFYCWFSQNIMSLSFYDIFDNFFNKPGAVFSDDGSLNAFLAVCGQLPGSMPNELPTLEYQETEKIPENPGGSSGFRGGGDEPKEG